MYCITVTDTTDDTAIAHAYGDLDAMAYHVRRLKDAMIEGKTYVADLIEVGAIFAEDEPRTVAKIEADPEVVGLVLTRRLAAERKAAKAADADAPEIVR